MERAPIIGVSSTATPSSTGCSFVRSSQKCLPPLSTTRGERTEARKKRVPHTLFSSSLSLFLDSEQCASTSMSRLLSRLLHPSPSFKAHPCVARLFNAALPLLSPWLPRHERRGGFLFCESTYFNKVAVLYFRREERETDCWVNQDLSEHDLPTYAYPQIRKPHPWKAPSSKRVNSSTGGANKLRYVY